MADAVFTAEEFAMWTPACEAYEKARDAFASLAASTLLSYLASGLIAARAKSVFVNLRGQTDFGFAAALPLNLWETLGNSDYPSKLTLWTTNAIEVDVYEHSQPITFRLFGIRFDPAGIVAMLPPKKMTLPPPSKLTPSPITGNADKEPVRPAQPVAAGVTTQSNAGRLRKPFWDDLLIAMFEQLWDGTLAAPTCAADIERAMLQWAENHNKKLGPTSVKEPAKKLFRAYTKEDKN